MKIIWTWMLCICLAGCVSADPIQPPSSPATQPHRNLVVWISVDGFKGDYIDHARTPFIHDLMEHAIYTRHLHPPMPSLTFPSHCTEATGVSPGEHGITANSFYDSVLKQRFEFPADPSLLQAEPIWLTATRQNIRCAVYDWPLSSGQTAALRTAYFNDKFDAQIPDAQRLEKVVSTLANDTGPSPLQLVMGYVKNTDGTGHEFGPDSPQIISSVEKLDDQLSDFTGKLVQYAKTKLQPGQQLYLIISTDHGMGKVKTLVNFDKLFAQPLPHDVVVIASASMAHIFLNKIADDNRRQQTGQQITDALKSLDYLSVYTRKQLPPEWKYDNPTRTGDYVVILKPGYCFNTRLPLPTFDVEKTGGPMGMHGYLPDTDPDMDGFTLVWRYPTPLAPKELPRIDALQLHPTVARLLHLAPATRATSQPLDIE